MDHEVEPVAPTPPAPDVGANPAPVDSSTTSTQAPEGGAGSNEGPKSAIEAIDLALEKTPEKVAEESADNGADSGASPAQVKEGELVTTGEKPEADFEPIRNPKSSSDHRWNRLLKDRNRALDSARMFEDMRAYTQQTGLSFEDIKGAIELATMMKANPHAALERMRPQLQELEKALGVAGELPPDLQERVDTGRIDEETARELAQMRAQKALDKKLTDEQRERQEREQEEREIRSHAHAVATAVTEWERRKASSDPDFAKKKPFFEAEVHRLLQTEGYPGTTEEAVKMTDRAYKAVGDRLSGLLPGRMDKEPTGGGTSTSKAIVQPKTALEAVDAALSGKRIAYS